MVVVVLVVIVIVLRTMYFLFLKRVMLMIKLQIVTLIAMKMIVMPRGNYNAEESKNTAEDEENSTEKNFPSFTLCFFIR